MTLDKRGLRLLFDEWLSDFGVSDRFEVDIDDPIKDVFAASVQAAKKRIPHDRQINLNQVDKVNVDTLALCEITPCCECLQFGSLSHIEPRGSFGFEVFCAHKERLFLKEVTRK